MKKGSYKFWVLSDWDLIVWEYVHNGIELSTRYSYNLLVPIIFNEEGKELSQSELVNEVLDRIQWHVTSMYMYIYPRVNI